MFTGCSLSISNYKYTTHTSCAAYNHKIKYLMRLRYCCRVKRKRTLFSNCKKAKDRKRLKINYFEEIILFECSILNNNLQGKIYIDVVHTNNKQKQIISLSKYNIQFLEIMLTHTHI